VEILFRVFNNLIFAYEGSGNPEKVQEIRWIQKALK
jgi:hypothetical protein